MSKPAKKNAKPRKKSKKSSAQAASKGQLIALEGTRGLELDEAVPRLARVYGHGPRGRSTGRPAAGWSRWDASNTFYELRLAKAKYLTPTPRTLILLYASDLLFRLRWEIGPALKEGQTVIAAPYVESAIGFGVAAGLSKEWLTELFSFAPKPDACFRLKEKKKIKEKKKPAEKTAGGFVEIGASMLAATSGHWDSVELRAGVLNYLDGLEESEQIRRLGKKLLKDGRF